TGLAAHCAASTSRSPGPSRPSPGPPVKRNRFIQLGGGTRPVNRELEEKARGPGRDQGLYHQPGRLPGWYPGHRGLRDRRLPPAVPDRALIPDGLSDLQARPTYHRIKDSIEAHLTSEDAALAASRWIEYQTG